MHHHVRIKSENHVTSFFQDIGAAENVINFSGVIDMIVRMWHGKVPTAKADAYRKFVNERAIPDYQSVEGNISVYILERTEVDITHFITLTFWKDLDSIKGFAGEDVEVAKYYPEDKDFLLEFEPKVAHYEVVGQSRSPHSAFPEKRAGQS